MEHSNYFPACVYTAQNQTKLGGSPLYTSVISQRRMAEKKVDRAFFTGRAEATAAFELLYW
jgi:hypothetical protein